MHYLNKILKLLLPLTPKIDFAHSTLQTFPLGKTEARNAFLKYIFHQLINISVTNARL